MSYHLVRKGSWKTIGLRSVYDRFERYFGLGLPTLVYHLGRWVRRKGSQLAEMAPFSTRPIF